MIIIYLLFLNENINCRLVPNRSFSTLSSVPDGRLFLAASKMSGIDVNMCTEMLWIDIMRVDVKLCRDKVSIGQIIL